MATWIAHMDTRKWGKQPVGVGIPLSSLKMM